MNTASKLTAGQGVTGAVLAGAPGRAGRWAAGRHRPPPAAVVRLLGVRMVAQAAAVRWVGRNRPEYLSRAVRWGAGVDLAHGSSMLVAAVAWPRYRRAALVAAGLALGAAYAGREISR